MADPALSFCGGRRISRSFSQCLLSRCKKGELRSSWKRDREGLKESSTEDVERRRSKSSSGVECIEINPRLVREAKTES